MSYIERKHGPNQGEVLPMASRREVVYFSCPRAMRGTKAYALILAQIKRRHPYALILEPALIWQSKDWRPCYRPLLDSVTHYYLTTRPDGTIDRASFHEYLFFQERCTPTWAISPRGVLPIQKIFILSRSFDSWLFCASVITGADGETAPGAA